MLLLRKYRYAIQQRTGGGEIIIPQEVTDIAGMAFLGCPNLFHILRCATSEVMSSTAAIP